MKLRTALLSAALLSACPSGPICSSDVELSIGDCSGVAGGGATRLPGIGIPGGLTRTYELPNAGPGVARRFYLAGIDSMSMLAYGFIEDAGMQDTDAGPMNCTGHAQCPMTKVCDLGVCKT